MSLDQLPARFRDKIRIDKNDCWLWTAALNNRGYSVFRIEGRNVLGHRFAYEVIRGEKPIAPCDHLCCVRNCVNPDHVEIVSTRENTMRGNLGAITKARHAAKTHCPRGHPYDEANTRWYSKAGYACRDCRTCNRERLRAKRRRTPG